MKDTHVKPRTVSAVGTIVKTTSGHTGLGALIEAAMQQAIAEANAEGLSTSEENSPVLRARMMAARQGVVDQLAEAERELQRRTLRDQLAVLE